MFWDDTGDFESSEEDDDGSVDDDEEGAIEDESADKKDDDQADRAKAQKRPLARFPRVQMPPPLRNFYAPNCANEAQEMEKIMQMKVTQQEIEFVYSSTLAQSNSLAWKEMRYGRITASVARTVWCIQKSVNDSIGGRGRWSH